MYQQVLEFWFETLAPENWWQKDETLDALIREKFSTLHQQASAGELFNWRESAEGSLAEVIVLDQFSRNIFRDSAKAFAYDGMALALAQTAVEKGFDQALEPVQRSFLYLPYMHSESLIIHEQALILYEALGLANNLMFEQKHQEIIARFGRYPHRNHLLNRESTAQELAFLKEPGSSF